MVTALPPKLTQGLSFIKNFESHCPNHGKQNFVQIFDNPPECVICQQERFAREEREQGQKLIGDLKINAMRDNNIDPAKGFGGWQFDTTQEQRQNQLLGNLRQYAQNFSHKSPNILLMGGTGTGKTHLCNGVAKIIFDRLYALDNKSPAKLIKTAAITRQIKDSWGDKSKPSEEMILGELAKLDFLVLDDLGDGDSVGGESGANDRLRFGQLIDARYQKAPTIITTNLSMEQVAEFLGDRAWDRFGQNMVIINCNWQSYRKRTRQVMTW